MIERRATSGNSAFDLNSTTIPINSKIIVKTLVNTITRCGGLALSMMIISGSVIKTAIAVDVYIAVATTIGIVLINSPIMPVEISRGKNAHTVVIVVVQIGTIKSFQTSSPVS